MLGQLHSTSGALVLPTPVALASAFGAFVFDAAFNCYNLGYITDSPGMLSIRW